MVNVGRKDISRLDKQGHEFLEISNRVYNIDFKRLTRGTVFLVNNDGSLIRVEVSIRFFGKLCKYNTSIHTTQRGENRV